MEIEPLANGGAVPTPRTNDLSLLTATDLHPTPRPYGPHSQYNPSNSAGTSAALAGQCQSAWSDSELVARILDGVADGIAAHDASGQLLFINDAGARLCGYECATSALSAPPKDFLSRVQAFDDAGSMLTESDLPGPLAARGSAVPERIVRLLILGDRRERWLSVKATPILDRRGAVRMSITIFRDVSRERNAEAERDRALRELEVERARFAALSAHFGLTSEGR
jgi:PAS domain-containing protein